MKKRTFSVFSLSLLLTVGVFSTSCSSDNDPITQEKTINAICTTGDEVLDGIWKQVGEDQDHFIEFKDGLFSTGSSSTNLENPLPYHIEGEIIVVDQSDAQDMYLYYFENDNLVIISEQGEVVYKLYNAADEKKDLTAMWKLEGDSFPFYVQFKNGVFAGGTDMSNPLMVSKYYLEDNNIILQTNVGYDAIPYSFEEDKLIIIQNGRREVYSYYGEALDITLDFTNFELLYRSNWTFYERNSNNEHLTVKFLSDGQFKYSYDVFEYIPVSKLDKTGTYRIEKDKIYMNWNDGSEETVQSIIIIGGTLILEYPEGSGKNEMKFYQS